MGAAPLLVIGIGNPSRGDDALGPAFVERASLALAGDVDAGKVELLTDYQLQIEHALDLAGRRRVVFVDASVRATPPFEVSRVLPRRDASHTSHALSPAAVLEAHRDVVGEPPEAWALAIRGERFELGEPLSMTASAHLDAALAFFVADSHATLAGDAGSRSGPLPSSVRDPACGRLIEVEGTVQGVGLRPWIFRAASALGLTGRVRNTMAGVAVEAFGPANALDAFVSRLQHGAPQAATIRRLRVTPLSAKIPSDFAITESASDDSPAERAFVLPADLATCDACLRDMADPTDRHYGYAFTSCTSCGPRLSLARALPFDRKTTAMAAFEPCEACARAYADPHDRRFHAQTLACPACGPRVWLASARGEPICDAEARCDAVTAAAARLESGAILGVQGVGAFHLVCDATQADVVNELRRRKRRDAQPLAVMVADMAMAHEIGVVDELAAETLAGSARPIVLVAARPGRIAAREVNGPSRRVGLILPYSPLHHRLLACAGRPLVVTSGNPSGGPAIIDHAEAVTVLGPLVDGFLMHDRRIERRVEDSVVSPASPHGVRVVRRARGFAPLPIRLPAHAPEPILAVGSEMRNAACFVVGDGAYLTPHLGDLSFVEGETAWRRDVEGLERLLGVRAEVLAHDLHPGYATTRYALARSARRRIGVQHHVAHVLAAIAELHVSAPALGIVYDGSGWGPDGTSWGAELLLVDGARWSRAASFRPLPLAGGERAIRDVWRVAFAALREAFGDESVAIAKRLPVFDGAPAAALPTIARMIDTGVETVPARGMGRWFDAIGAMALHLPRATFDGHVAMALEEAASDLDVGRNPYVDPYPVSLPSDLLCADGTLDARHEIDLRPTIRAVVGDLLTGRGASLVAARFHRTIVDATVAVAERILAATGVDIVVLAGGSMQNRVLERGIMSRMGRDRVRIARDVPVNDGGLALGQAWAAVLATGGASV
jgi:hydrogenase maturation protein HypF